MTEPMIVGEDWAWEAAFITIKLTSELSSEGERAVSEAAAAWFRRAAFVGYGDRFAHNAYDPSFERSSGRTTIRIVIDFGPSLEDGLNDFLDSIRKAVELHRAEVGQILLNIEDPSLFTLE